MSSPQNHRWLVLPDDREELLNAARDMVREIREAADEQSRLPKLKGNEEMIAKLEEVLREIDVQFDKIAATVKSSDMVHTHLKSLCVNVQQIHEFFEVLRNTKVMIFAKGRLRKQMTVLHNNIRNSCTQLMASVSLELLTNKDLRVEPHEPTDLDKEVAEGNRFYFGINRHRNYTRAFKHYVYAAERGHLDAMVMVAESYASGRGVEEDVSDALLWLEKAHTLGSAAAKYQLGIIIIDQLKERIHATPEKLLKSIPSELPPLGADISARSVSAESLQPDVEDPREVEEGFQRALALFTESAEMGHIDAQTALGQMFELAEDYEVAKKWYEVASSHGCLRATNLLGMLYFDGRGVPKLREKAFGLFEEACKGGDVCAMNNVAMCLEGGFGVEQDIAGALSLYKKGADGGSARAAYSYGYLLLNSALKSLIGATKESNHALVVTGRPGDRETEIKLEDDLREGVRYLRSAVERGVGDASYQLGRLYEQGVGVPYDVSASYSYFLWAARLGHAKAALYAANMLYESCVSQEYRRQIGISHHSIESARATEQNNAQRDDLCESNLRFAAALYQQAGRAGIPEAMNAYAVMVEEGLDGEGGGVSEAATWYHAAAEAGYLDAAENLGLLLSKTDNLSEINTLDGRVIPSDELKEWIATIASSPLIPASSGIHNVVSFLSRYGQVHQKPKLIEADAQKEYKDDKDDSVDSDKSSTSDIHSTKLTSSILLKMDRGSGAISHSGLALVSDNGVPKLKEHLESRPASVLKSTPQLRRIDQKIGDFVDKKKTSPKKSATSEKKQAKKLSYLPFSSSSPSKNDHYSKTREEINTVEATETDEDIPHQHLEFITALTMKKTQNETQLKRPSDADMVPTKEMELIKPFVSTSTTSSRGRHSFKSDDIHHGKENAHGRDDGSSRLGSPMKSSQRTEKIAQMRSRRAQYSIGGD